MQIWPLIISWAAEAAKFVDDHNGAVTAVATIIIAGFTVVLARVTGRQARLTRESIDLARAEFVSTHRPRIIVRNLSTYGVVVGHPITINFMVMNIRESVALLVGIESFIFLKPQDGKIPRALRLSACQNKKERLVSGDFEIISQVSDFVPERSHIEMLQTGERLLCIAGCVSYSDDNRVHRRTGFVRYCDISDLSGFFTFSPIEDAEYEYAY
jgi:hypothetical protein